MILTLERKETSDVGTFGLLRIGNTILVSGELPWRENAPDISCIPCGTYACRLTFSNRFKRKMILIDVPNRSGIRIHSANFMGDSSKGYYCQLHGCIALGEKLGIMEGQKAVLVSRPAVEKFESLVGDSFTLEIKNA